MKEHTEVTQILDDLRDGKLSLQEVADLFRQRHWPRVRKEPPSDYLELARRAQEDPDPYVPGSFDDVDAAYFRHELTDDQFEVLQEAVLESMRREDAEREPGSR